MRERARKPAAVPWKSDGAGSENLPDDQPPSSACFFRHWASEVFQNFAGTFDALYRSVGNCARGAIAIHGIFGVGADRPSEERVGKLRLPGRNDIQQSRGSATKLPAHRGGG